MADALTEIVWMRASQSGRDLLWRPAPMDQTVAHPVVKRSLGNQLPPPTRPPPCSITTVTRLKADWWQDYEAWQKRDLSNRQFLYIWADGVYFKSRMAEEKQCVLVVISADEYGRKELLAMADGFCGCSGIRKESSRTRSYQSGLPQILWKCM